jgi:tetratricopeptide (TPR) repeat protein
MFWQFSNFMLDSIGHRLLDRDGQLIPIQPKAFRVLEVLVRDAPNVVSREELLVEVWGHSEFSISCLSQAIREIRRALGDDANQPAIIGTQHGTGYFLLVKPEAGEPPEADNAVAHRNGGALAYTLIAGAGLFMVLIASLIVFSNGDRTSEFEPRFVHEEDSVRGSEVCPAAIESYSKGLEHLALSRWAEAIGQLEIAQKRDPESLAISFHLARAYFHAGYQRKAVFLVEQNVKANQPRNRLEALKSHAAVSLVKGNLLEYSTALATLADFYPDRLDYLFELFDSQLQSGSPSEALPILHQIMARHPSHEQDARFWLAKARLNLRDGNLNQILDDAGVVDELARGNSTRQIHARTLLVHADAMTRLGDIDSARMTLSKARSVLVMTHDPASQINLIMQEVGIDIIQGRLTWIPTFINEGCQISESIGYMAGSAHCNRLMATVQQEDSNPESSLDHIDQAVQLFVQSGDILEAAMTLVTRVQAELDLYRADGLTESLAQAEAWFSLLQDRRGMALVQAAYGERDAQKHEFDRATEHLEAALKMFGDSADAQGEGRANETLARLLLSGGMPTRSAELFGQALEKFERLGDYDGTARVLVNLGELAVRTGKLEEGEKLLNRALRYSQRGGREDAMSIALNSLARAAIIRTDLRSAHQALDHANSLAINNQRILANLRSTQGTLALVELDLERSEQAFQDARSIREWAGDPSWLLTSDSELAVLLLERGQIDEAVALSRDILERLPPFATAQDRIKVKLVLAEGLVQSGNRQEASIVLDSEDLVSLANTDIALYFRYSSMKAVLGPESDAVQTLSKLSSKAQQIGFKFSAMELDVVLAMVMMRSGTDSSRAFVIDLVESARDRGVHCIPDRIDRLSGLIE